MKKLDFPMDKVLCLSTSLEDKDFGLDAVALETLRRETSDIIHCAWPVNFTLPLAAFESQIATLQSLISLSLNTRQRSRLLFCSSVGVAQSVRGQANIASAPMPFLEDAAPTGYAQSKLVGERIVQAAAAAGADTAILRIGQIVPGVSFGTKLWNPSEAVPLMIRSSSGTSTGALPILSPGRDACSWLQADTLADAILNIAGIRNSVTGNRTSAGKEQKDQQLVYNLVNPRLFSWRDELVPALRLAGLKFDLVPWTDWLRRLELSSEDITVNPSRKLLDFWAGQTQSEDSLTFDVSETLHHSPALETATIAVEGDFVRQLVDAWTDTQQL